MLKDASLVTFESSLEARGEPWDEAITILKYLVLSDICVHIMISQLMGLSSRRSSTKVRELCQDIINHLYNAMYVHIQ